MCYKVPFFMAQFDNDDELTASDNGEVKECRLFLLTVNGEISILLLWLLLPTLPWYKKKLTTSSSNRGKISSRLDEKFPYLGNDLSSGSFLAGKCQTELLRDGIDSARERTLEELCRLETEREEKEDFRRI